MPKLLSSSLLAAVIGFVPACSSAKVLESRDTLSPRTAPEKLESYVCGSIPNMHELGGVFLASQPTLEDFEQAKACGVRTVINLRPAKEQPDLDERARVTGLGLAYVNLPFNGAAELTDEIFAGSRELLNTSERPILLHCASANRVGAVWIPWRVLDGGIALEQAVAEAKTIGLKTVEYEAKARDYVARNVPAKQ